MGKSAEKVTIREAFLLFNQVCETWGLSIPERLVLLGKEGAADRTYRGWVLKANQGVGPTLSRDVVDRIAYVVGTFESATSVWGSPEKSHSWLTSSSHAPEFGGAPPLARMLRGGMQDIRATWVYIFSIANGHEGQI